jgi:hypothetical protein
MSCLESVRLVKACTDDTDLRTRNCKNKDEIRGSYSTSLRAGFSTASRDETARLRSR